MTRGVGNPGNGSGQKQNVEESNQLMRSHFTPILTYLVSGFSLTGCYWNDDGTTLPVSLTSTSSTVECIEACIASNSGYIFAGTQQVNNLIRIISLYYII